MFSPSDTIVAIATPPGRSGLGVVRLSGPDANDVAHRILWRQRPLEPRRATLTRVGFSAEERHQPIDQVVATYFPAPGSYTGDEVVELSAHGNPVVLKTIVSAAIDAGARLAEPGEFTLRAYLNGRMDLMQAEAVADLIEAVTPTQARAAFDQLQGTLTRTIAEIDDGLFDLMARLEASIDFPDEGYHFVERSELVDELRVLVDRTEALLLTAGRGRLVREGLQVAILGRPNVGKSSLFNALVGCDRAIVTDIPGTTRDLVTEMTDIEGLAVSLVDTAGLRQPGDPVEVEGVSRSRGAAQVADVVLWVFDRSEPLSADDTEVVDEKRFVAPNTLLVANKSDLTPAWERDDVLRVSAVSGDGLDVLRRCIARRLAGGSGSDRPAITNLRHITLMEQVRTALVRAWEAVAVGPGASEEFVLADLQSAKAALEEVTGRRASDDLLAHIFSRFCIGK